jgi:POT family proton-dependent oligopeptide transporter
MNPPRVQHEAQPPQSKLGLLAALKSHPPGLWFFFWGEFAERCSYYGMRAILLRYMAEQLGFGDALASKGMSYFVAACYLLPLAGGYIADNFFGKYWTIVGFSIPYILGHVILGVESTPFLVTALVLLAMGSGVIKPNISTLMGLTYDQWRPGQAKLRSDAFAIFYGAINVGAAISSFAMPMIRTRYSYSTAFLFPAALMMFSFLVFAAGKRFYGVEPPKVEKTAGERHQQAIVLRRLMGLFIVVTFFWIVFDQAATTWTLFARDYCELNVFGYQLESDQIQGINPILIILLLPPITFFWHWLSGKGFKLRATDKMMVGFVLTTVTTGVMATAGLLTADGQGFDLVGSGCLSVDHLRRNLHFGRGTGAGLYGGPRLHEGSRHRVLVADGFFGQHVELRSDSALRGRVDAARMVFQRPDPAHGHRHAGLLFRCGAV